MKQFRFGSTILPVQLLVTYLFAASAIQAPSVTRAEDAPAAKPHTWAQWRGPRGDGITEETNLPVIWNEKNVVWATELEGTGQSSPVSWEDQIFLTSATNQGRDCQTISVNRLRGTVAWTRHIKNPQPEKIHDMNSWATPTCATDGEVVVSFFGNGGLHCYDLNGSKLWSRDLGRFERAGWGTASSPIIVGDSVIQTCDADNVGFLVAFDKTTGKELWRTDRDRSRSFSTPLLAQTAERPELILNGPFGVHSYDPATGRPLWFVGGGSGRGTPTVVMGNGLAIVVSGRSRGDRDIIAVRPGGSGDVSNTHLVWHARRGGRDLPSPIVVGNYLFTVNLRPGIAACYDVSTGRELWRQRLNAGFSASPISAQGRVYALSERGETIVIEPGTQYKELARNQLGNGDEIFRASLMPYRGQIFCRSNSRLYCIAKSAASQ